jgi:DNA adenine methylase
VTPSPFLKWAGGKSQLLDRILPQLPEQIATYYEPFIGGGAVFFALANRGRFRRAVISDRNPALVEVYTVVRDEVIDLIDLLSVHSRHATDSDYYYEVRAQRLKTPVERAARILFLNKTCYNGLYRVNRRGEFNVPFGRYANPRVLNEELLNTASRALQKVEIIHSDFEPIADRARRGDAVYFDPPYHPISQTASFTAYDSTAFGMVEQERLAAAFRDLCGRAVSCVLSNSDCDATRTLYEGLDVKTVFASRAINSRAERRGPVTELLVVNKPTIRARAVRGAA